MLAPEWWLLAMSLIVALGSDTGALGPVILALGNGQGTNNLYTAQGGLMDRATTALQGPGPRI